MAGSQKLLIAFLGVLLLALLIIILALSAVIFTKIKSNSDCNTEYSTAATGGGPTGGSTTAAGGGSTTAGGGSTTAPVSTTASGASVAAKLLLDAMNRSADPCDDFFNYACGQYIEDLRKLNSTDNSFNQINTENTKLLQEHLRKLLSGEVTTNSTAVAFAARYYSDCVHSENDTAQNEKDLKAYLKSEFGGWPVISTGWKPQDFNLAKTMGILAGRFQLATLVSTVVFVAVEHDVSGHALVVDQAQLSLGPNSEPFYLNSSFQETLDEYQALIVRSMLRLSDNPSGPNDTYVAAASNIIEFEKSLAKFNKPAQERRNYSAMYNPDTVGDLKSRYPFMNWADYFAEVFYSGVLPTSLDDSFPVVVTTPTQLEHLNNFNFTSEDIANYLLWRLVYALGYVDSETQSSHQANRRRVAHIFSDSKAELTSTESACIAEGIDKLKWSFGRMFLDAVGFPIDDVSVANVKNFALNLISQLDLNVKKLGWLDAIGKANVREKLQEIIPNVVFPQWIQDNTQLDAYYDDLIAESADLTMSYFNLDRLVSEFNARVYYQNLVNRTDRFDFQSSPAWVNAWYEPTLNSITIPAAILQQPFYRPDFPAVMNYGGIGVVIGHELTHSIDDEGSQFDGQGHLHSVIDKASFKGFEEMASCVVKEYSSFCYPNLGNICVDGTNTQGENIADNGGLKTSFRAFLEDTKDTPFEPLPGMESYTAEQIFFLNYARIWCTRWDESVLRKQLLTNVHSPAKERVHGAVRNFDEFGKAFKCTKGTGLYPNDPCIVW